jgi:glutathione synthase/RimK-type ligase-like ATP-grasp enzyme
MGKNVALIKTQEEFLSLFENAEKGSYVFQNFFETHTAQRNRSDLRIFVIKNKAVASVLRIAVNNSSITSNASQGGIMQEYQTSKKLQKIAIKIIKYAGLDYGTADFLLPSSTSISKSKPAVLCEINASPGFEAIETQTNVKIAEQLVKMVLILKRKKQKRL